MAHHSQKKARVTLSFKAPVAPENRTICHQANMEESPMTASSDKRLFFRLLQDHEWYKLYPVGIREALVQKLIIYPSLI